eukprot:gnl/Hemi2/17707_TR5840_c0_g1_i1.p1 gnl/Hemi2/17707_TR5840_c0_g1~~gnl/Hemi2/17707_TR5840_c0_g1_i1.p1  ORF type:complete len:1038 (-),score=383.14 gnl/Hemi2/17707_TR5840_c0_g1_i1:38-3151(-)
MLSSLARHGGQRLCQSLLRAAAPRTAHRAASLHLTPPCGSVSRGFCSASPAKKKVVNTARLAETVLAPSSATYVEQMYEEWRRNPTAVPSSWHEYFRLVTDRQDAPGAPRLDAASFDKSTPADVRQMLKDTINLYYLVRAYQVRGHRIANLDPLGMSSNEEPAELKPETYGWTAADMHRPLMTGPEAGFMRGFLSELPNTITLAELIKMLRQTYCDTIGVEYMHIQDRELCNWIRSRLEKKSQHKFSNEEKKKIYDRLAWADRFESYLSIKFGTGQKRFGLDGAESLIPGLKGLIDQSAELGVEGIVMGMPHRGRLNVLANVVRKPHAVIFQEFKDAPKESMQDAWTGSGDVKYHLGTSCDRVLSSGKRIHVSLVANPSHLEAVDPVVEGKARAKQFVLGDSKRDKVMSLLLHGDASFAGQGVIYETISLSGLRHYTTGGTIHVVVNNQVGFTTDPHDARPGMYCTDLMKMGDVPIFHVNGDDPEAVVYVSQIAAEWRQTFHKDCIIDIICYRRFGHNEADQPLFTQPLMYKRIAELPSTLNIYKAKLLKQGVMTEEEAESVLKFVRSSLDESYQYAGGKKPDPTWLGSRWHGLLTPKQFSAIRNTGVPLDVLQSVGKTITTYPSEFQLHPTLTNTMNQRKKMFETGKDVEWAVAEQLAFGTLLLEGVHVRLSGQDCERGTFGHRHSVLHDQVTGAKYTPLDHVRPSEPSLFNVCNSNLSEYAVMGFEYGYSTEQPNQLVLWEAQFGDFANGAQVMIDQFFATGEQKWARQSGLVLLLPHGYDGQGPEHSSARLERFLQLSDSDPLTIPNMDSNARRQIQESNLQICNITTPANYFHVLRRQIKRDFRKPLVIMSPKSLLRHPRCVSDLQDMDDSPTTGTTKQIHFMRVLPEAHPELLVEPAKVERLVLCSGKLYYELLERREKDQRRDVALVRVEQLAPFPWDEVLEQVRLYKNASVVWCQEEPMNMGAWSFVLPHLLTALNSCPDIASKTPCYVGRPTSASTAVGSASAHKKEQASLIDRCFAPLPQGWMNRRLQ